MAIGQNINENELIGKDVTVSGWGADSTYLKRADVTVISNLSCRIRYENLVQTQMCAGRVDVGGPCLFDDGAPIVVNQTGTVVQVGLFSHSNGCVNGTPGVYTRISPYLGWIGRNV